jgi:lipoyl(octanoyl) transferase
VIVPHPDPLPPGRGDRSGAEPAKRHDGRLQIAWLGRTRYEDAIKLQRQTQAARIRGDCGDTLLLTEHERVLTTGRHADARHLRVPRATLSERGIELVATERGGDITYHGPGQLVAYAICDLRTYSGGVRGHVRRLEESAIRFLRGYGVDADRRQGTPGVWVEGDKIASLGVYVSRSVTMHGIAINVSTRLADFDLIDPCGLVGMRMTSIEELRGSAPSIRDAAAAYAQVFEQVFEPDTTGTRQRWPSA